MNAPPADKSQKRTCNCFPRIHTNTVVRGNALVTGGTLGGKANQINGKEVLEIAGTGNGIVEGSARMEGGNFYGGVLTDNARLVNGLIYPQGVNKDENSGEITGAGQAIDNRTINSSSVYPNIGGSTKIEYAEIFGGTILGGNFKRVSGYDEICERYMYKKVLWVKKYKTSCHKGNYTSYPVIKGGTIGGGNFSAGIIENGAKVCVNNPSCNVSVQPGHVGTLGSLSSSSHFFGWFKSSSKEMNGLFTEGSTDDVNSKGLYIKIKGTLTSGQVCGGEFTGGSSFPYFGIHKDFNHRKCLD